MIQKAGPKAAIVTTRPGTALGIYTTNKKPLWDEDSAAGQERLVATAPRIIHRFAPWELTAPHGGTWGAWDDAWASSAIALGCVPMITWEGRDMALKATAPQSTYSNAAVTSGTWDTALQKWLYQANTWLQASAANRLLLRLDHEGNGQWYQWAAGCNGNSVESAIAAFRHKARLVRSIAPKIEIIWCPGTSGSGWIDFEQCYPGYGVEHFVNYTGLDFYNTSTLAEGWSKGWVPFSAIAPYYYRVQSLDPRKRIIVCETGCVDDPTHGDKAGWIRAIPDALANLPAIAGVVWFDNNDGKLDFRVSANEANLAAWKAIAADPRMRQTV